MSKPLTMAVWTDLVADEIVMAYSVSGLPPNFAAHADWAGRKLIAERWTEAQARWCIDEVTRTEPRFTNLLAMLNRANAGQVKYNGEAVGGWRNSRAYAQVCDAARMETERAECVTAYRDGYPMAVCGSLARCVECSVFVESMSDRTGKMTKAGGE